jgi:hypothetical protein
MKKNTTVFLFPLFLCIFFSFTASKKDEPAKVMVRKEADGRYQL